MSDSHCPHYREASALLDSVNAEADLGEFFSAGCWYAHALEAVAKVADPNEREELMKRAGGLSEEITEQERCVRLTAQGGVVHRLRSSTPSGNPPVQLGRASG